MRTRAALMLTWVLALATPAAAAEWRPLETANALRIETSKGVLLIELRPEIAPNAVDRIKRLVREGIYDGLQFHRVIDGFVAQTGNPNNQDGGTSTYPNLAPEFTFRLQPALAYATIQSRSDLIAGFIGVTAFEAEPRALAEKLGRPPRAWGLYCAGAVGMGRQEAVDTANSEFFIMRAPSRRLERGYTYVGQVVAGLDIVRALAVGEPPPVPDVMRRAVLLSDLPAAERPRLEVMDMAGEAFRRHVSALRAEKGPDFSPCDVSVPTRGP